MRRTLTITFALPFLLLSAVAGHAANTPAPKADPATGVTADMVQTGTDIAKDWKAPRPGYDYDKRVVEMAMRDGVKLHTVILIPHGAKNAPILLERTPYDADEFARDKIHMRDAMRFDPEWADAGYIVVYQDIRGKNGSKGDFVMNRPPVGPLNPSHTDDTTDAWDTVAWLADAKNLPEGNGKVGMIGSSYDGWTVAMALLHPHPALKAAIPESPMVDGWMGDDWFHYGAFRQINLDYFVFMTAKSDLGHDVPHESADDYRNFLEAGSAGAWAAAHGYEQLPWWKRLTDHPAYDTFWQQQAMDRIVAAHPSNVPTMWLQGEWDQEDIYGAIHCWEALTKAGHGANNHLVMGPWYHSQINGAADHIGPLKWKGDTAADFRKTVMIPFFDHYLRGTKGGKLPKAMLYNPSKDQWDRFADWKPADQQVRTPLYLQPDFGLGFDVPKGGADSYVSDPAKPVPFMNVPVELSDHDRWTWWLVTDQRPAATRTDVLSYQTPVLDKPVTVQGAPVADLFVKTTGTDADFVVKVIDVFPATNREIPELAGYQLPISLDIFRGRYRKGFAHPEAIPAGQVQEYAFRLPTVNYVFKPGHRIMVQIQSSLFPLYDRNPQTFVKNIFFAKPEDYKKATMTVEHGAEGKSAVLLPVVGQ